MCSSRVTSDYFYFFIFFVMSVYQGPRPTRKNSADRATFDVYFAGFFCLNFFFTNHGLQAQRHMGRNIGEFTCNFCTTSNNMVL